MSKLPNPEEVNARLKALAAKPKEVAPTYDIGKLHSASMCALKAPRNKQMAWKQFEKLVNPYLHNTNVKNLSIGWSVKHQSITVSLFDCNELKSHIIRTSTNWNGDTVKWKTYGSKTFTPCKITDSKAPVYLASGIGEYVLFEIMGVDYIAPQCDSCTGGITSSMVEAVKGRVVMYLQDNDDSARKLKDKLKEIFRESTLIAVNFEHVHDKELLKGFDFRDICNQQAVKEGPRAWEAINSMFESEIRFYNNLQKMKEWRMKYV